LDYGKYKNARNASWQCLLDYGIDRLPVMITHIIKQSNNIRLFKDSNAHILKKDEIGRTIIHNSIFEIIYKDIEPSYRCRFTIAHELGHIFLGHLMISTPMYRTFTNLDEYESAANVFARDLLAPACVLHELNIHSADNIARLCNISKQSAEIRAERMQLLEIRNAWYLHPLEIQVYRQFENFIKENNHSKSTSL